MLTTAEVKKFNELRPWRSSLDILGEWLLVILTFVIAIRYPHPVVIFICGILMARHQLAFAVFTHDGAHRRLFKSATLNDYIGQFVVGAPLLFSMFSYRHLHLKHHRAPLAPDDPDISLTGGYPVSKASFARKMVRDLTGLSYFKFISYFIYLAGKPKAQLKKLTPEEAARVSKSDRVPGWLVSVSIISVNFLIWFTLYMFGHGWFYLLWIIPAMTVLQFLLRIRGIAEHAGYQPNENQMLNSRTVINPFEAFFFAPHNVNYHIEHHVYPSIPYYNLPKVHALLKERGALPQANLYTSYRQVVAELVK